MDEKPKAGHRWWVRLPLIPLSIAFLLGSFLGSCGGAPRLPALVCLGLSLAGPTPLGFAAGGLAAGVLASSTGPDPAPTGPLEGPFAGVVDETGRDAFGQEEAVVRVWSRGRDEPVRLRVRLTGPEGVPPAGSLVLFRARLEPPRRQGEAWRGRLENQGWVFLPPSSALSARVREWFGTIRARVRGEAEAMGEEGGVLAALALGETAGLSPRVLWEFRAAGTYHLLAVSGVHVAAALMLFLLAARPFALASVRSAKWWLFPLCRALASAAALLFYLGVVRDSSSASRAAIFGGLLAAGALAARERSLVNTAAASLLLIAGFSADPRPDLSLALSLCGCLGIAASWREEDAWPTRLLRVSLGASLFTLPLVALCIRGIPALGPAFNLLIGAAFDALLIPLTVAGDLLAGTWEPGAHGLFLLWRVLALPLLLLQRAALPDWAYLPLVWPGAVLVAVMGVVGSWLWWRRRGDLRVAAFLLLAPLAGLGGNLAAEALSPPMEAVLAGAGQADLALLKVRGKRVLIDAGPPPRRSIPLADRFLAAEGVGRVDLLILTHPHPDHAGGATFLLEAGRVAELALPGGGGPEPWKEVLAAVPAGVRVRFLSRGDTLRLGAGISLTVHSAGEGEAGGSNRSSLVLACRGPGGAFLFPGDATWETTLSAWAAAGPLALLKVPHHGSVAGGFPGRFPPALRADLAVFCAGDEPSRGLPAPAVRKAFHRALIPVAFTGREGVRVRLEARGAGLFR